MAEINYEFCTVVLNLIELVKQGRIRLNYVRTHEMGVQPCQHPSVMRTKPLKWRAVGAGRLDCHGQIGAVDLEDA